MSRNVLRDKLLALALRDDFPATFVRRERERERRFWANVDHTAFQALITNLIPYFAFKRLISIPIYLKTSYSEIAILTIHTSRQWPLRFIL